MSKKNILFMLLSISSMAALAECPNLTTEDLYSIVNNTNGKYSVPHYNGFDIPYFAFNASNCSYQILSNKHVQNLSNTVVLQYSPFNNSLTEAKIGIYDSKFDTDYIPMNDPYK